MKRVPGATFTVVLPLADDSPADVEAMASDVVLEKPLDMSEVLKAVEAAMTLNQKIQSEDEC